MKPVPATTAKRSLQATESASLLEAALRMGLRSSMFAALVLLFATVAAVWLAGLMDVAHTVGVGGVTGMLRPLAMALLLAGAGSAVLLPLCLLAALGAETGPTGSRRGLRRLMSFAQATPSLVIGIGVVAVAGWVSAGAEAALVWGTAVFGLVLMAAPGLVLAIQRSLARVPELRLVAARALGASSMEAWLRVGVPQVWRPISASLIRAFSRICGDAVIVLVVVTAIRPDFAPGAATAGAEVARRAMLGDGAWYAAGLLLFTVTFSLSLLADLVDPPRRVR